MNETKEAVDGMHKPKSRLRWLFSETFVIVLGVLIALGLDDYWTARQEKALELQYVKRIHANVSADIAFFDQIRERLERKLQALDSIAPIVRGQEPVPEDVGSFLRNVALGGLVGASSVAWVTRTTFEDLVSTGNLRLIRNSDLRREILLYYDDVDKGYASRIGRQTGYAAYVHSLLPAELRENMNLAAMEKFGTAHAVERFNSSEFQDLLNQEYNYAFFVRRFDARTSAKQLLNDLENYIQHLDGSS